MSICRPSESFLGPVFADLWTRSFQKRKSLYVNGAQLPSSGHLVRSLSGAKKGWVSFKVMSWSGGGAGYLEPPSTLEACQVAVGVVFPGISQATSESGVEADCGPHWATLTLWPSMWPWPGSCPGVCGCLTPAVPPSA